MSYECVLCGYPIDWDDMYGWLHEDFGPEGRSFDHDALVEFSPMTDPTRRDGSGNG